MASFFAVSATDTFQQQLDQAEALRTQSPTQTAEIVAQLESDYQVLTAYQQQQFTFLKAYIFAFQGKQDDAITWATKIAASEHPEITLKST